jgi:putative DNA primase/helicase
VIGFIAPFQILDYLERLKVVKETSSEYHCLCPVCGDGGFKVNKKNGSYQAFKCGCEVKDIREAVRPWSEVQENQSNNSNFVKPQQKKSASNAPNIEEVRLARLAEIAKDRPSPKSNTIPEWLQSQEVPHDATQTRYWYSKTQWVSRFEWKEDGQKKKTIRQGHIKSNGLREWNKGSKDWRAYRLSEAVKYCQDKWVLAVEGEGCVETARAIALSAITWQGSNWKEKAITSDLTKLIEGGAAGLVYFPDHDETGEKKAKLVKSACEQVNLPCLVLSPTDVWKEMPAKGDITDWVKAHPNFSTNELITRLNRGIAKAAEREKQEKQIKENEKRLTDLPNWSQSDIADWLATRYESQLAWNVNQQEWYRYGSVTEGIYSGESAELIGQLVKSQVKAIANETVRLGKKRPSYTISFINGITALLKLDLAVRRWNEASGLLPLLNGVLDLKTKKLLPHSPENRLTWCLPYNYNILATCEPIQEWLLTMCGGDRALVELMRAYLLGILTGRTDWQKYLELIGPGGTGKSTFTRLATALVGTENVHTTTLHKLEKSKFEPASIAGKRLVLINDSERYAGEVGKLKNLTGQDTLPYEVKFKQSKSGFNPDALVIVSTNEVIQSSDYTSGLARRRISIPMFNQIKGDRQKNLIEHKNGQMYGDFLPYIPGLLNWVLAMDEEVATKTVKNYEESVPSLLAIKAKTLVETNPIADWLDNFVVYDPEARTNIGVAKRDKDSNSPHWYLDTDRWLYPNYAEYCHNSGTRPVSLRRFVTLLSDLGKNQLGLEIKRERDRFGSYFVGLKIRSEEDHEPPLITGNSSLYINTKSPSSNTNVINRLWAVVMDKVTDVIDYMMTETIDSNRCDESDGKIKKSLNNEDGVESKTHRADGGQPELNSGFRAAKRNTKNSRQTEFLEMPSYAERYPLGHRSPKESPTQRGQATTDNQSAITVGDRVILEDCPGHWNWASPFTVEAIEGEMVKLEMVSELVEIERLSGFVARK